jgi:hypothetical protein
MVVILLALILCCLLLMVPQEKADAIGSFVLLILALIGTMALIGVLWFLVSH